MKRPKWTEADRFIFATQRLRAQTQVDRVKEGRRRVCRGRIERDDD